MQRTNFIFLFSLVILASCKGQRFYWESSFRVADNTVTKKEAMIRAFKLTGNLSAWHPVFGRYCAALPSYRANLFVCWKEEELRVFSSYNGAVKGDAHIRTGPSTVEKYLRSVADQPGFAEHQDIKKYVERNYRIRSKTERLLTYGRGSILIKEELERSPDL